MVIKRPVGRPTVMNFQIITKLADAIQHSENISDACSYAGISRDTYYRHLKNDLFAKKMADAKKNQNKVVIDFLTVS